MSKAFTKMTVRPETKELLIKCKEEFIRNHPEMSDIYITEDFILRRMINYYLNH